MNYPDAHDHRRNCLVMTRSGPHNRGPEPKSEQTPCLQLSVLRFRVAREPTVRGYNVPGGRVLIMSGD